MSWAGAVVPPVDEGRALGPPDAGTDSSALARTASHGQCNVDGRQRHPYSTAVETYYPRGWRGILPLPPGRKVSPPKGYTGYGGVDPSYPDMFDWATDRPDANCCLRLPDDVIGIDVDAYDSKSGASTLVEAELRWGPLPATWRSSSRPDDPISGIQLFTVPPGTQLETDIRFPELGIGDIEIVQRHHRYVMCGPAVHPEGRVYRWYGPDGDLADVPPGPDDLPPLPSAWLEALAKTNGVEVGDGAALYDVEAALTEGAPSPLVQVKLDEAVKAIRGAGSRHDAGLENTMTLLRCGQRGEPGVAAAVSAVEEVFVAEVVRDGSRTPVEARGEFQRFISNKRAARLLAQPDDWAWARPAGGEQLTAEEPRSDASSAEAGGADAGGIDALIEGRMHVLRINREALRRLDQEDHPPTEPPPVKSLDALLAEADTPTRFRIADVAPVGSRIILSAQYKAGKTTMVGNLVRALVDGDPFLGRFAPYGRARVGLIDDELSENMNRRWLRDQGIVNTRDVVDVISLRGRVSAFDIFDDRGRRRWAARLADLGCDYLILDCLRAVLDAFGLDENRETGRFLVAFDALLAEAGIEDALLVHHMGHGNERARGDSRLQDWPDVIWRLVRETEDPTSARYFTAVGRDVDVPEGRLGYEPATRRLTYAPGSRNDNHVESAQLAVLDLLGALAKGDPEARGPHREGLSKSAVEGQLGGPGCDHSRKAVRAALDKAVREGAVAVVKGPHGSQLHHIAYPCAECGAPVASRRERHESCLPSPRAGLF